VVRVGGFRVLGGGLMGPSSIPPLLSHSRSHDGRWGRVRQAPAASRRMLACESMCLGGSTIVVFIGRRSPNSDRSTPPPPNLREGPESRTRGCPRPLVGVPLQGWVQKFQLHSLEHLEQVWFLWENLTHLGVLVGTSVTELGTQHLKV